MVRCDTATSPIYLTTGTALNALFNHFRASLFVNQLAVHVLLRYMYVYYM
jgi:hypothetical protein